MASVEYNDLREAGKWRRLVVSVLAVLPSEAVSRSIDTGKDKFACRIVPELPLEFIRKCGEGDGGRHHYLRPWVRK